LDNDDIKVERLELSFDRGSSTVTFDVAGTSGRSQEVTAALVVSAYGQEFEQRFDPCDEETKVEQLCPREWFLSRIRGDRHGYNTNLLILSPRRSLRGSWRAKDRIRVCQQDPRNRLRHPQSGSIRDLEAALEGWK
jgi:hypothetical protein